MSNERIVKDRYVISNTSDVFGAGAFGKGN